ncbi:AAR2 protein-domain-containing protein [Apodospora peruviana]|uniref:AAR2 protein-domain-containing protein n=1 Tax=Apodospora peruviana TaxID=516989 RepID=A0AAE0HVY9_9PEZI|nr:AAR2 protein-domain-containing protein [Apodospora peruviana]
MATISKERGVSSSQPNCLDTGDVFLLLGLPANIQVGHDIVAFRTVKKGDDGFRDIPQGPHFLWVDAETEPQSGASRLPGRCGYWYFTESNPEIRLKQWDKYNEVLGEVASKTEVVERKANIETIYPTLRSFDLREGEANSARLSASPGVNTASPKPGAPQYGPPPSRPIEAILVWRELTWAISDTFLQRVTNKTCSNEWLVDSSDSVKREHQFPYHRATAHQTSITSEFSFLFEDDLADLYILDKMLTKEDAGDTSARVTALLGNPTANITENDIVAEMQFTYIMATDLRNAACLTQWLDFVLKIMLRSWTLVRSHPVLCRNLIHSLHAQLSHSASYGVHDGLKGSKELDIASEPPRRPDLPNNKLLFNYVPQFGRKLRRALTVYKHRLDEMLSLELGKCATPDQKAVGNALRNLEGFLWQFKWDLGLTTGRDEEKEEQEEDKADGGGAAVDVDGEDDDYLPLIVDVDENGREAGLVSF